MVSVSKNIEIDIDIDMDDIAENLDMWDARQLISNCGYGPSDIFDDYEILERVVDVLNSRDDSSGIHDLMRRINITWKEIASLIGYKREVLNGWDDVENAHSFTLDQLSMISTNDLWAELGRRAANGDKEAKLPDMLTERDKMKIEAMDLVTELVATVMKGGE